MTYGISTTLANNLLNHVFRAGVSYTPPTAIYAKLHLGDPGAAGTANSSALATRLATTFAAAASGQIVISNNPEFTLTASETIAAVSFWDTVGPTGGTFLYSVPATVSKAGVSGDIIRLNTNVLLLGPLAA